MNSVRQLRFGFLLCCLCSVAAPAMADVIDLDSAFSSGNVVVGSHLAVSDFKAVQRGTVTIKLSDLRWSEVLESLSTYVTSHQQLLVQHLGPGTLTFDVAAGQTFATSVFAIARGDRNLGFFAMDVTLAPAVSSVPVPAAFWLLASGLAGLAGIRRKRATVTIPVAN